MKHTGKRIFALLLTLVLVVSMLPVSTSAAGSGNSAALSSVEAAPGDTAEVTLTLTTENTISHFYLEICCDDDLPLQSVEAGSYYVEQDDAQGGYSLDIYKDAGKQACFDAGTYTIKLTYQVPADATLRYEYELYIDCADFHAENGTTPWSVVTTDGKITVAESSVSSVLHGGETITKGGSYTLADDATGIITVNTTEAVTVSGSGVKWDEEYNYTADTVMYSNLKFDCSGAPGARLTLKDMFLEDRADTSPLVNFAGAGNTLNFEGVVVMDKYGSGQGTYANIHVPQGASLTIGGSGTLYLYKTSGGSGIGGNKGEMNGEITFAMTGSAFIKGTKQGAVIGAGTGAKGTGTPGKVEFLSGTYNLVSNSRGAVIGGSAGSEGASSGTEVYFKGGSVNINTDYSGSSVGGGGYNAGNDASGGTAYISGGSLRIYVDNNAAKNVGSSGYYKGLPMPEGVNNVSMTAQRKNADGENVYLCIVDTKGVEPDAKGQYTVKVDGETYFTGGLHEYGFIQEGLDKGEQLTLTTTVSNWYKNDETRLFVYLTGEEHQIQLNNETPYTVTFDSSKIGTIDECNGNIFTAAPAVQDSISLDQTELRLTEAGKTAQLTATAVPAELPITWTSSDEAVATVDGNGLVNAVSSGTAVITASAGSASAQCTVLVTTGSQIPVFFFPEQDGVTLKVSDYVTAFPAYPYTRTTGTGDDAAVQNGFVVLLTPGTYTYTVTKSGYYGSTCGFTVKADGTVAFRQNWNDAIKTQYGLNDLLDGANASFYPDLEVFTPSSNAGAWDGVTLDVSWFDPNETTHIISTPAQFAGLAAIVNGIYNDEIETILDYDASGVLTSYTPAEYDAYAGAKIKAGCTSGDTSGPNGNNQVTTNDYYFSALGYDFDGHTVYLAADLDMGGYQDADGSWTGARYMPIGGQYVMRYVKTELSDGYSHLGASFNGKLEGNGHLVYNIYCDRYSNGSNFGDSQSIGLIGRLGIHDSDYSSWKSLESQGKNGNYGGNYPAVNPSVRNVAVAGYIYGRRSVGGIVGKIGQTSASNLSDGTVGGLIENCVNFATVHNTDSKGVGGIVGASWNSGAVRGCVNFGSISTTYSCPTGGIVGSNEVSVVNCYNMGQISAKASRYAMAIGTNNGGGTDVRNCYWLTGSAPGGGYYGSVSDKTQIKEITDNYSGTALTAAEFMQSAGFVSLLNGSTSRTFKQATASDPIYQFLTAAGYAGAPVPRAFTRDVSTVSRIAKVTDPTKLAYVEGERFDPTGLEIRAYWSDGTDEVLDSYTYSIDRPLALGDTEISVTVTAGGKTETFTFPITVSPVSLSSISVYSQPTRRAYNEGECFDPAGMRVKISYTNGTTATAVWQDGKFVDSEDASKVYDTLALSVSTDQPLTMAQNGKAVTATYTFTDGVAKSADTNTLTILSAANKPKQENGVYLVGTPEELDWIAGQINYGLEPDLQARLTADITASKDFAPMGTSSNKFTGTFDGDYHRVTLSLNASILYMGLFGSISDATVKNTIVDGQITAGTSGRYVGGIVGCASGTSLIENCGNEAAITGSKDYLAGIVGRMEGSTTVRGCYNWGSITNTGSRVKTGGITGEMSGSGCVVENCYNWGAVTGNSGSTSYGVGGIVGVAQNYNMKSLKNVYNAGVITDNSTSNQYKGAIIGSGYADKSENYYWLENCGTDLPFGRHPGETGGKLNSAELKAKAADLGTAFKANTAGFPLLTWQADNTHIHSWGEWTQTKAPTCSAKGEESRTCAVGGEIETRSVDMIDHSWGEWTQTKAPTCSAKGEETRTCAVGGESETRSVDMIDHSWGEWTQTKAPTCSAKGEETRTCAVGGESETREVDMIDHSWGEWTQTKAPTCSAKGEETRTCAVGGESETQEVDVIDHSWGEWTQTKAPTCSTKGEETRTCAVGGESETREVDVIDHSWGEWTQTKAPTCSAKGEETRTCAVGGESETREVDVIDHSWGEWTQTKAPTCSAKGEETRTCAVGGESETRSVDMIDHSWGEWTQTKAPTCSAKGEESRTCAVGGETETQEVDMIDHSWGEWTQAKAPTCSAKGEETRTCAVGGESETRELPQLSHVDVDHDSRCDLCGAALETDVPATGDAILPYAVLFLTASLALLAALSKKKRTF